MSTKTRRMVGIPVLLAAGLAAAMLLAAPAWTAFPGENGGIAFESNRGGNFEIYTMNADGTDPTNLTNDPAADFNPAYSSDGRKIAFVRSVGVLNTEIFVMDADGSNQTNITNDPASDTSPAFSPDGSKIAFVRLGDIFVINADGTGTPTNLTNDQESNAQPAFSPNGELIAFRSLRDGNAEIYTMNADGSNQTRRTDNAGDDEAPNFSPDGNSIAFVSTRDDNGEIYIMDLAGNNPINLTNNLAGDSVPAFSPDGSEITFASAREGDFEIYTMNADGTDVRQRTTNSAGDGNPDWQPLFSTDLSLIKRDSADPATVGEDLAYTITVTNEGPTNAAHDIVVKDRLPTDVSFVSASQGCAESNGLVTCELADLPPGEEAAVEVVVQPTQEGVITNTAWVSSVADLNPENDSDRERTEVVAATVDPPPDTTPPQTTITAGPTGFTNNNRPTFEFTSNEADATFECRLDSTDEADFHPCRSPFRTGRLAEGEHTFEARATDPSGNPDDTPASRVFTVDAVDDPDPPPPNPRGCTKIGTNGNDVLVGTPGRDVICGLGGNDTIRGKGGNDTIHGDAGNDRIYGGAGNDILNTRDGVRGNDRAHGGPGRDRCATDPRDRKVSCP